jgi:hypothetical protein
MERLVASCHHWMFSDADCVYQVFNAKRPRADFLRVAFVPEGRPNIAQRFIAGSNNRDIGFESWRDD